MSELVTEGDYRIESGFAQGMRCFAAARWNLLRQPSDDNWAVESGGEIGVTCPEDFGLVSFDDYPWLGVFRPRLTTVELPKHQLAAKRLNCSFGESRVIPAPVLRKLQPELRIRESCGFGLFVSGAQRDPNLSDTTPTS